MHCERHAQRCSLTIEQIANKCKMYTGETNICEDFTEKWVIFGGARFQSAQCRLEWWKWELIKERKTTIWWVSLKLNKRQIKGVAESTESNYSLYLMNCEGWSRFDTHYHQYVLKFDRSIRSAIFFSYVPNSNSYLWFYRAASSFLLLIFVESTTCFFLSKCFFLA